MTSETPRLPSSLLQSSLGLGDTAKRIRWYMCVTVALSSLNYPDVIPQVYEHFSSNLLADLPPADRLAAVQKIREGLIKSTGIVGAARTGNAIRTLSNCIPDEYRETESPRSKESEEVARKRGRQFWKNIYARNKAFDPEASVRASPDYAFVVRGEIRSHTLSPFLLHVARGALAKGFKLRCTNQIYFMHESSHMTESWIP